jgi:hypothetical protein
VPVESAEINALLKRVDQFSSTNDSKLIPKEKKNSQIEVRTNERHRNGGVVYVSVGAVILIVILVLVLL